MFRDRLDAGHRLVRALGKYRGQRPLVLAVPRGAVVLGRVIADGFGATDAYLEGERALQLGLVRRGRAAYAYARRRIDPGGRVAIVVGDGLATGLTMIAALRATRARGAAWIVCAVPVASPRGLARVRPWCDEIVTLATPHDFYGVSAYYADFRQVTDADVVLCSPPVGAAS